MPVFIHSVSDNGPYWYRRCVVYNGLDPSYCFCSCGRKLSLGGGGEFRNAEMREKNLFFLSFKSQTIKNPILNIQFFIHQGSAYL